jgi:hypothetical protein
MEMARSPDSRVSMKANVITVRATMRATRKRRRRNINIAEVSAVFDRACPLISSQFVCRREPAGYRRTTSMHG